MKEDLGDEHYEEGNTPLIVPALWSIKHWGLCQEWASPLSFSAFAKVSTVTRLQSRLTQAYTVYFKLHKHTYTQI